jgi:hypothetical protein
MICMATAVARIACTGIGMRIAKAEKWMVPSEIRKYMIRIAPEHFCITLVAAAEVWVIIATPPLNMIEHGFSRHSHFF